MSDVRQKDRASLFFYIVEEYTISEENIPICRQECVKRVGEAPFDSMRKMMSTVHTDKDGFIQFTKGAPDEERKKILEVNKEYVEDALRVFLLSYRKYTALPFSFQYKELEKDLLFYGLARMIDPIRPEVKKAVEECKESGIRAIMITGDHKDTAVVIAKELGLIKDSSEALTGSELDRLSDEDLDKSIASYSVYARVKPEHKVRIVQAWKKKWSFYYIL